MAQSRASAALAFSPPESWPTVWKTISPVRPKRASRSRTSPSTQSGSSSGQTARTTVVSGRERLQPLVVVADLDLVAELDLARVGLLAADQGLDQRRLARAVGAHHADALAAVDGEVQVLEERLVVRLGQLAGLDDDVAGALDLVEAHDRADDVAHRLDPLALEPLELPLAVVGLLGPLARAVLADVGLELRDLLVLALGLPLEHLGLLGPEPPVLACSCRGRPRACPSCSSQILVTTLSRK